MKKISSALIFAGLVALVPVSVVMAQTPAPGTPVEKDGEGMPIAPGHDLTLEKCTTCHGASNFTSMRNTSESWAGVISSMNADINDEQFKQIQAYLTTWYGPNPAPTVHPAPAAAPAP